MFGILKLTSQELIVIGKLSVMWNLSSDTKGVTHSVRSFLYYEKQEEILCSACFRSRKYIQQIPWLFKNKRLQ